MSKSCYDGIAEEKVYPDGMEDDGTWDGESVVCDPCYIRAGQPGINVRENPTRDEVNRKVDEAVEKVRENDRSADS